MHREKHNKGCKSLFEVVGAILGEGGYFIIFWTLV